MMKTINVVIAAAVSSMALSGCSVFAVDVSGPTQYSLTEVPAHHQVRGHGSSILLVMAPDAAPYYRSTQMAYELKPHQVSYYTRNAWAETPGSMMQPLLVKTLQNTNRYHAIVTQPVTGNYDYMLTTQILTLRANLESCPGLYEVTVRAQVFSAHSNKAIATKDVTVFEPIHCGPFYNNVLAANHAVAKALSQVAKFTLRVTH